MEEKMGYWIMGKGRGIKSLNGCKAGGVLNKPTWVSNLLFLCLNAAAVHTVPEHCVAPDSRPLSSLYFMVVKFISPIKNNSPSLPVIRNSWISCMKGSVRKRSFLWARVQKMCLKKWDYQLLSVLHIRPRCGRLMGTILPFISSLFNIPYLFTFSHNKG